MEPLYKRLLSKTMPDSASAIEYCRKICAEFGFTVKQEASANKNIYVYCSREGLPDSQRHPRPPPRRRRPSKRCDCRWRAVLHENEDGEWEFRKSMNPDASEHNHPMMLPDEMVQNWPNEVTEVIMGMARQGNPTHAIREAIKQKFPTIVWNERRFYNRLSEERKKIKQKGAVDRIQRLWEVSSRLLTIVAAQDGWATSLEDELSQLLARYAKMAHLSPEAIVDIVDLPAKGVVTETSTSGGNITAANRRKSIMTVDDDDAEEEEGEEQPKLKKRKTQTQTIHVPGYTIQVQPPTKVQLASQSIIIDHRSPSTQHSPSSSISSTFSVAATTNALHQNLKNTQKQQYEQQQMQQRMQQQQQQEHRQTSSSQQQLQQQQEQQSQLVQHQNNQQLQQYQQYHQEYHQYQPQGQSQQQQQQQHRHHHHHHHHRHQIQQQSNQQYLQGQHQTQPDPADADFYWVFLNGLRLYK
ncbi:hypothetical protein F4703DRAFT_1864633 [Phycomyces blakesleeanus]